MSTATTDTQAPGLPYRANFISVVQFEREFASERTSLADFFFAATDLGANGVELRPSLPGFPHSIREAAQMAGERNLSVVFATMSTLFTKDAHEAGLLRQNIETARDLGAKWMRVFAGEAPARDVPDHAYDDVRQAIGYAQSLGVTVLLENAATGPGSLITDIARILDVIPHPNLAVNLDIGNCVRAGDDILQAITRLQDRIASVHLKDLPDDPQEPAVGLGEGILPLDEILAALQALPQPLLYILEFPGGGNPHGRIRTAFERLLP
jgi:sugar phosphate isomerase/epimerase